MNILNILDSYLKLLQPSLIYIYVSDLINLKFTNSLTHTVMALYASLCLPMPPWASLCLPMPPYAFVCLTLPPYASICLPMPPYASQCLPMPLMDPYGTLWPPMAP